MKQLYYLVIIVGGIEKNRRGKEKARGKETSNCFSSIIYVQLEEIKREEQKKAKQQKKLKEAEKPKKEEKISLTYSKKELKKAEELKREKQREKDLKLKKGILHSLLLNRKRREKGNC